MLQILTILTLIHVISAGYSSITVYGDVFKDKEFFTKTFPWIIDNIGGELQVDYHLLGSGRYSIPQMCVLKELRRNTFLQAQYLKCEAEGRPSKYCLCETGIDSEKFTDCVHEEGYLASYAAAEFQRLGVGATPLIELGFTSGSTVFGVADKWFLKKICSTFGEYQPMGCVKSCCNSTETFVRKPAIAQFNKDCGCGDVVPSTTTTTTSLYTTPYNK